MDSGLLAAVMSLLFYDLSAGGLELFFVGTNFLVLPPKSSSVFYSSML